MKKEPDKSRTPPPVSAKSRDARDFNEDYRVRMSPPRGRTIQAWKKGSIGGPAHSFTNPWRRRRLEAGSPRGGKHVPLEEIDQPLAEARGDGPHRRGGPSAPVQRTSNSLTLSARRERHLLRPPPSFHRGKTSATPHTAHVGHRRITTPTLRPHLLSGPHQLTHGGISPKRPRLRLPPRPALARIRVQPHTVSRPARKP